MKLLKLPKNPPVPMLMVPVASTIIVESPVRNVPSLMTLIVAVPSEA